MAIVYNNKDIREIYYGGTRIRQVYLGSKLIWERASRIYATGANNYGQYGNGGTTASYTFTSTQDEIRWASLPIGAETDHIVAIKANGEMWGWGRNVRGQVGAGTPWIDQPTPLRLRSDLSANWVMSAVGGWNSLAINATGELYTWGDNSSGKLGIPSFTDDYAPTPIRVGTGTNWKMGTCCSSHCCAITTDGYLFAWGGNDVGQLGQGDTTNRTAPTQVGSASNWKKAIAYGACTIALNTSGELYGCGYNNTGGLGLGDTTNRDTMTRIGTASNWVDMSAGSGVAMAINSAGELWAWGSNGYGQLCLGDTTMRTSPTRVGSASNWAKVTTGYHTLAVNDAGELYAGGRNSGYQLGFGDTIDRTTLTKVTTPYVEHMLCGSLFSAIIGN